jgi:hypothetical protein
MGRVAQIISTARYLPAHVVTNAELTARFTALGRPTVIDRLGASSGITQRFYAPDDWVTSDLALPAAKEALNRAGREPEEVDLIILGTISPDYVTPDYCDCSGASEVKLFSAHKRTTAPPPSLQRKQPGSLGTQMRREGGNYPKTSACGIRRRGLPG